MSDSFPLLHGLPEIHCDDLPRRDHMAAGARGIIDNMLNRRLKSVNPPRQCGLHCSRQLSAFCGRCILRLQCPATQVQVVQNVEEK